MSLNTDMLNRELEKEHPVGNSTFDATRRVLWKEIESLRAELAAEREKVAELEDWKFAACAIATQQLARAQLDKQRLREALIVLSNYAPNEVWDEYQYLATTADTAALDAYVVEKAEPYKAIAEAAKNLVKVKGRYHSEQAMNQLIAAITAQDKK